MKISDIVRPFFGSVGQEITSVYLAAQYSRRVELRDYAAQLAGSGYEITSNWIYSDEDENQLPSAALRKIAEQDLHNILDSNLFVLFTENITAQRAGRMTEFGYALSMQGELLKVVVIGPKENIFCNLVDHIFPDWESFMEWINK